MSAVRQQGGATRRGVVHQGRALDEEDVSSCESSTIQEPYYYPLAMIPHDVPRY